VQLFGVKNAQTRVFCAEKDKKELKNK